MARTLNKVELIGRLGKDPEMKYTAGGTAVCSFSVATNRYAGKDETNGQAKEETEWHKITAWDKLAETCNQYLRKGLLVYVSGSIQTRTWEQDGVKRYMTEIVIREMIMLERSGEGEGSAPARRPAPGEEIDGDDLPF